MTTPDLPDAMIEAAAKARFRMHCGPFGLRWGDAPEVQAQYIAEETEALAAALEVCEVREDFAADCGTYVTQTPMTRAAAQREVDAANSHSRARGNEPHTVLVRRLLITTPAEPVETEGGTGG